MCLESMFFLPFRCPKTIAEFLRDASFSGTSQPVHSSSRIPETARLIRDLQVINYGQQAQLKAYYPFSVANVCHNVITIITIILRKGDTPITFGVQYPQVTPIATPLLTGVSGERKMIYYILADGIRPTIRQDNPYP